MGIGGGGIGFTDLWLARNEGMDPYSSPYIIVVSFSFSVPSFPANQRAV